MANWDSEALALTIMGTQGHPVSQRLLGWRNEKTGFMYRSTYHFTFLYWVSILVLNSQTQHQINSWLYHFILTHFGLCGIYIYYVSLFLTCMGILPACKSVRHLQAWYSQGPEEGVRSPGTTITDGCELPGGCWELKLVLWESSQGS